jgi:hypothetical protein
MAGRLRPPRPDAPPAAAPHERGRAPAGAPPPRSPSLPPAGAHRRGGPQSLRGRGPGCSGGCLRGGRGRGAAVACGAARARGGSGGGAARARPRGRGARSGAGRAPRRVRRARIAPAMEGGRRGGSGPIICAGGGRGDRSRGAPAPRAVYKRGVRRSETVDCRGGAVGGAAGSGPSFLERRGGLRTEGRSWGSRGVG